MVVIAFARLRDFWQQPGRGDAEQPLKAWFYEATNADWATPADVKNRYASASFLADNRVVFNIRGGNYRLVTLVHYGVRTVYIRFIGTHAEYDRIDASTV